MLPGVFPEASAIPFGEGMAKGLKGQDLGGMDGKHICHHCYIWTWKHIFF